MNETGKERRVFKYNMSIYYQSTLIYLIVFVLYIVIKGEFIENSFTLITKDPVIYFFVLVIFISVITLLYNLYLNRYIEITDNSIIFKKGSKFKTVNFSDIIQLRIAKERRGITSGAFKLYRIRVKNRKLPVTIRPYDYENKQELIDVIKEIKHKVETKGNV